MVLYLAYFQSGYVAVLILAVSALLFMLGGAFWNRVVGRREERRRRQ